MTIKMLSGFFGKSERTIRRACEKAGIPIQNGVQKVFSREEVEVLSLQVFSSVPEAVKEAIQITFSTSANGKGQPRTNAEVPKIMSGAQIREVRLLWEKGAITKDQVADLLGIPRVTVGPAPLRPSLPPPTARESAQVAKELQGIIDKLGRDVGRTSAAVTKKLIGRAQDKAALITKNLSLDFGA